MNAIKTLVVVVDGGIGAGKTSYIDMINKGMTEKGWKITVVKEPVDKWRSSGILSLFYQDPKRWAYHFQTKAFHDRVVENINSYKNSSGTDRFLLERSPLTDKIFMDVLYDDKCVTDLEYKDYHDWWSMWNKVMPYKPDLFIYLRPDIDIQMERIEKRHRSEEINNGKSSGVTRQYQEKLVNKHDKFFETDYIDVGDGKYAKSKTLKTNENFKEDLDVQARMLADFEDYIYKII